MIQHNADLDFSFLSHGINIANAESTKHEALEILEFVRLNPGVSKQEIAKQFTDFSQFQVINILMSFASRGHIKKVNGLYYSDAS